MKIKIYPCRETIGRQNWKAVIMGLCLFRPIMSVKLSSGQRFQFKLFLEWDIFEKIKKFIEERNITEYMLMLAALAVVLQKYARQSEIIIGTPVSGRTGAAVDDIVGMFVEYASDLFKS